MRFILTEAKNGSREEYIELNTIEDVMDLMTRENQSLIFSHPDAYPSPYKDAPIIVVYNDYIE